jgi:3D (Asp-Asp-Asp) domain-containing protein
MKFKTIRLIASGLLVSVALIFAGCDSRKTLTREVTATAYNSLKSQTHNDHPDISAWGDTLKPGMKSIAVSRDLIPLGLTRNTKVKIEGLPGTYLVLDKMNKRWRNKIDIYMGTDKKAAREWGKQKVFISWKVEKE